MWTCESIRFENRCECTKLFKLQNSILTSTKFENSKLTCELNYKSTELKNTILKN